MSFPEFYTVAYWVYDKRLDLRNISDNTLL